MRHVMGLFGAAEKGHFKKPYTVRGLSQLVDWLGNPPPQTEGLFFAIQGLLFGREVIYFRVQEEGFSKNDYFLGLQYLHNLDKIPKLHALCLPGLGDKEVLDAFQPICELHKTQLIMSEKDLFDYLHQ